MKKILSIIEKYNSETAKSLPDVETLVSLAKQARKLGYNLGEVVKWKA